MILQSRGLTWQDGVFVHLAVPVPMYCSLGCMRPAVYQKQSFCQSPRVSACLNMLQSRCSTSLSDSMGIMPLSSVGQFEASDKLGEWSAIVPNTKRS